LRAVWSGFSNLEETLIQIPGSSDREHNRHFTGGLFFSVFVREIRPLIPPIKPLNLEWYFRRGEPPINHEFNSATGHTVGELVDLFDLRENPFSYLDII
jgi:hypothetical protein